MLCLTLMQVSYMHMQVGYFALNVPSGLSLYYVSNSALTLAVQLYLRKLGGAKVGVQTPAVAMAFMSLS